jgi:formylglycine-generating enzyme
MCRRPKANLCGVGGIVLALALGLAGLATAGEKEFVNSVGMRFLLIPSGEFMMGGEESLESVATNPACNDKPGKPGNKESFQMEHPRHKETISKAFYMQETEVTVDQFRRFTVDTGYRTDAERER